MSKLLLVLKDLVSSTSTSMNGKLQPLPQMEANIAITVSNAIKVWSTHLGIRAVTLMLAANVIAKMLAKSVPV